MMDNIGNKVWWSAYKLLFMGPPIHSTHRVSPHHDTPFTKTRHCGDIYPDRHLLVEIHLHDKICRLWTQRKRWRYILSPSPLICPQQASKIKSSLYIIHCTEAAQIGPLQRGGRREGGKKGERESMRDKRNKRKKSGAMEGEREREWLGGLCIKGRTVLS